MANVLDGDILVREFELYVHFLDEYSYAKYEPSYLHLIMG